MVNSKLHGREEFIPGVGYALNRPTWWFVWGENPHNNHHLFPGSLMFRAINDPAWSDFGFVYTRVVKLIGGIEREYIAPELLDRNFNVDDYNAARLVRFAEYVVSDPERFESYISEHERDLERWLSLQYDTGTARVLALEQAQPAYPELAGEAVPV